MDYEKIREAMEEKYRVGDIILLNDYFSLCRENGAEGQDWNRGIRGKITEGLRHAVENRDFDLAERFNDLLFRSLLFGAPYYFDDYLQAVEYGKPYDKKFYAPRRHYLKRYVDAYQEVYDGKLDFLSISMLKRGGKAVTLDTLLPTPHGFKRMGDVSVGDTVISADGTPTKVTDVFPQGKVKVYEVKFSDGAVVKTCGEHLWKVKHHNISSRKNTYSEEIITTGEMLRNGLKGGKGRGEHNLYSVEHCLPVEFARHEIKLDPYVLGVILGDGTVRDGTISFVSYDHEVTDYICGHLPDGDACYCQDEKKGRWIIKSKERRTDARGHMLKSRTREILEELGVMGKLAWEKSVPKEYLFNSPEVRFELLCGLLDTDGCTDGKQIEFSTTSPSLREDVVFLVRSLGGKATWSERMGSYRRNGEKIQTRTNYRVRIFFPAGIKPFKIQRKAEKYAPKRQKLYRYIESITPCGEEEAQCIRVDHPEHLFLVGEYFVPTHNSQLGINFTNMVSGRRPDKSTLMEGTGDALVNSFYQGCLEYLQNTEEYHFHEIFPESPLVQTNADTKIINLEKKSRFPTIMCRSIDARQVGLSEATNLLYLDDCVEGTEEAENRARLDAKWEVISGDVIGRALEGTPIVICGTRYSLYDPIGRLQEEMRKQGKRMKVIETPALDLVTDESNFEYEREGKKFFSTKWLRDQRSMLSKRQWEAEFQQQPFESKGLTLPTGELNYYMHLPVDVDPDAVYAFCDTAEGGGDFTAMPVLYIYGDEWYLEDVVYDDGPPNVTKPLCVKALMNNHVSSVTFESNNAGMYYARDVGTMLSEKGYICNVKSKRTISNKETRIELSSDTIKKHVYFKDPSMYERGSMYDLFFREVTTHTRTGKVKHDDGIDSLSMAVNELRTLNRAKVEVFSRPF